MLQDVRVVIETTPRKLLHKPPWIFHIPSLCFPPVHASPFDQHGRNCQEAQNLASIDRNAQVSLLLFCGAVAANDPFTVDTSTPMKRSLSTCFAFFQITSQLL